MATADSHQPNGFSADAFSHRRYIPRQLPQADLAPENAWVSLQLNIVYILLNAHLSMCIPLQVAPAPAGPVNNQLENIPPPGRGVVAEPARMQDLHHFDVAYQGIVDYHPQPLAVSNCNFHLSADGPLINQ
jgi:hypothetical protein